MKEKQKLKTLMLNKDILDVVEKIRKEATLDSFKDTIVHCINVCKKQTFKDYIVNRNPSSNNPSMTPKERAQLQVEIKEEKENAEREAKMKKKVDICLNVFKGEVVEDSDGIKVCKFRSFGSKPKDDTIEFVPLQVISEDMQHRQFIFGKEETLADRPDVKELFKD